MGAMADIRRSALGKHALLGDFRCVGKTAYVDRATALRIVRFRQKDGRGARREGDRGGLSPYRCPRCNAWHVGSSSEPMPRNRR
jgi:hypothetical protein